MKINHDKLLENIKGGDERGYYHLTYEEWAKVPYTPQILNPTNGAIGINQVPQIQGSSYHHPYEWIMMGRHMQIASDEDFNSIVFEIEDNEQSPVFQVTINEQDNSYYLNENTVYYCRIRYKDQSLNYSAWSKVISFKTIETFDEAVFLTPTMLMPIDGGLIGAVNPVMAMTSAKTIAGTAVFDKGDWQISKEITFSDSTQMIYNAENTSDVTIHRPQNLNLDSSTSIDFYARGRQGTSTNDKTDWSIPVHFRIRPDYDAPIFGLRRVFSRSNGRVFCYNIDEDGEIVNIKNTYFNKHPLYNFPQESKIFAKYYYTETPGATDISQNYYSLTSYVSPIWEKCNVYRNNEEDLIIDLWFSASEPSRTNEWFLDPAFIKSPNGLLIDSHLCCSYNSSSIYLFNDFDNTKTLINEKQSYVGCGCYTSNNIDNYYSNASSLGSSKPVLNSYMSSFGYHFFNIYERRLLLDLLTAEKLTIYPKTFESRCGLYQGGFNYTGTKSCSEWRSFQSLYNICVESNIYDLSNSFTLWAMQLGGFINLYPNKIYIASALEPNIIDENLMKEFTVSGLPTFEFPRSSNISKTNNEMNYVSDIYTGYDETLGINVALLGIPKEVTNESISPFGIVIATNNGYTYASSSEGALRNEVNQHRYNMCVNRCGLFGVAPSFSSYNNYGSTDFSGYFRTAKWL